MCRHLLGKRLPYDPEVVGSNTGKVQLLLGPLKTLKSITTDLLTLVNDPKVNKAT